MLARTMGFRKSKVITHFVKTDSTTVTSTSTTAEEATEYTINWSDLTAAGFSAGDDVFIRVGVKNRNSDANQNTLFSVGFGTTFAGRTEDTTSTSRVESSGTSTNQGSQYIWIDRRTLVASENIYFKKQTTNAAGTASYQEFSCFILRLNELSSNDFIYDEQSPGGNAPDAFDTNGASVTVPLTGDWLFFACTRALIDAVDDDYWHLAIHDGTSDISEVKHDGEDTGDEDVRGTLAYKAGLASTTVVRTRYHVTTAATHDIATSKIFGLRLGAFLAHDGVQTASSFTYAGIDQFTEFAGSGSYAHPGGPLLVLGWPIHTFGAVQNDPYGRIQIGGSDWPAAGASRCGVRDNGAAAIVAPGLFGYAANQAAGTLDIDLDSAIDSSNTGSPACTVQVAAVISLTLA